MQITLDGIEDVYIIKKGTTRTNFRRVIENIITLCELIKIKIRLNADKSNYQELMEIATFLLGEKELKGKIEIFFSELKNYNQDSNPNYYSISEATEKRYQFYYELSQKGLQQQKRIVPVRFDPLFCGFKNLNSLVIGPEGEFYKCQHYLGEEDKTVGDIAQGLLNNEQLKQFYRGIIKQQCKECNLYPVCRYNSCPILFEMIKQKNNCNIYNDLEKSIKFQCKKYISQLTFD